MDKLYIPVLLGTIRPSRRSYSVAKFILSIGHQFDNVSTELVDPKDFSFPCDGDDTENKDPKYSEITARADGFMIVTPEYNHSFPGSLKRMLDSEYDNYAYKAVGFVGVSSGTWGGVRAIEALSNSTRALKLIATHEDLHFPKVKELFDENGKLLDDRYIERAKKAWTELIWLTQALKQGRSNLDKT